MSDSEIYAAIPDKKTPPHARGENTMSDLMKKIRAFYNWLELTGHVEGSRAFSRYREIDKEIKTNVVKLLDD